MKKNGLNKIEDNYEDEIEKPHKEEIYSKEDLQDKKFTKDVEGLIDALNEKEEEEENEENDEEEYSKIDKKFENDLKINEIDLNYLEDDDFTDKNGDTCRIYLVPT